MSYAVVWLLPLGLAGCVTLPANPEKMTADQLREWSKDKNATVTCAVLNSPYGKGSLVALTLDKGIVVNGVLTVDDACKVTIQSATKPAGP